MSKHLKTNEDWIAFCKELAELVGTLEWYSSRDNAGVMTYECGIEDEKARKRFKKFRQKHDPDFVDQIYKYDGFLD